MGKTKNNRIGAQNMAMDQLQNPSVSKVNSKIMEEES